MKKQKEEKGFLENIFDVFMEWKLYQSVISVGILLVVFLFILINGLMQIMFHKSLIF